MNGGIHPGWVGAVAVAIAAAATLAPRPAGAARDLAEILKEKKVITEEELAELKGAKPSPTVVYKEGKGFVFATPDQRFSLNIGGRLQVRYTLTDIDSDFVNASKGVEDSQSIDIPRARLWWEGTAFTPDLFYKVQIDVAGGSGDILRDAELGYVLAPGAWAAIKGGQMKTPFCRQEMTSSGKFELVERALACANFRWERARGLTAYGSPYDSLFEYYVGVFNTTGRNGSVNPDDNFLYVARLVTNPLGPVPYSEGDFAGLSTPRFALGASYGYEKARADIFTNAATVEPSPTDPDVDVIASTGSAKGNVPYQKMIQPFYNKLKNPNLLTAEIQNAEIDLAFRWIGLDLQFEYFWGFNANSAGSGAAPGAPYVLPPGNFNSQGYYAQAGYFVIPKKLQLALRYSELTPNEKAKVTKANGDVVTQSQDEFLGALSWYFYEHNLQLQTDLGPVSSYGLKDTAGQVTDRHDFRWRVQAQVIF